jgi:hypothetical protein
MGDIPKKQSDFLAFCTAHSGLWLSNAAAIGVLPASATSFKTHAGTAQASFDALTAAKVALKGAVTTNDAAMAQARSDAADIIKTIRAFAESSNNPGVYTLAGITPPAKPTPAPAPSKPEMLSSGLQPGGALTLYWKATNPRGGTVTYSIARKLPHEQGFTIIANTGGNAAANGKPTGRRGLKQWTDNTLPLNSGGVQYIITGMRGNVAGDPSETLTVTFGVGSGGGMFIASSVTSPTTAGVGIKMAA